MRRLSRLISAEASTHASATVGTVARVAPPIAGAAVALAMGLLAGRAAMPRRNVATRRRA